MSPREYRSAERGESWKMMLIVMIEECMKRARSKKEFIELMRSQGYDVKWTDTRKYITYTTPEGMRCRDNKLHEDKFLKGTMEYEFAIREEITGGTEEYRSREDDTGKYQSVAAGDKGEYDHEGRYGTDDQRPDQSSRFSDGGMSEENKRGGKSGGEQDRPSHDGGGKSGWENEREFFKQSLYGEGSDEGIYIQDDVDFSDSVGGDSYPQLGIGSFAAGLKHLIDDDSDDPEERRKRIEAQQNGEAIGLLLGTAAGLLGALADDEEDEEEDFDEDYDDSFGQSLF